MSGILRNELRRLFVNDQDWIIFLCREGRRRITHMETRKKGISLFESIRIIERGIRRSVRIILAKRMYDSIFSDIYTSLEWFLPSNSYKYFSLCTLFHIIRHGKVPFLNSVVIFNSDRASHCTRSVHDRFFF
jgi:hypothetical protein